MSYDDCLIFFPKVYLPGIMPAKPLQELAFVCGVITALSIIYLSHLPCHLCTLSFLYHLNYGKDKVLTSTILCSHHPQLANAIEEFMVGGLWAPISSLAISYLDLDVSTIFFFSFTQYIDPFIL